MLARLEPSALPTASCPAPLIAALIETIISGAEVPTETTVNPMIIGEIPKFRATAALPSTNRSAPRSSPSIPINRAKKGKYIVVIFSPKTG